MSRYCTGNVTIGSDMCSLVESQDYTNDESIKRTKFLENVKEGDALLIKLIHENNKWILFYVAKVESDSLLYFTPRFSIGEEELSSYDYTFPGQINDQTSSDGRYCFNSSWYTSRDYTCFFHLPEVRRGDRAWASIFDAAIVRADKLMKACRREPVSAYCTGGMIKRVLGTVIPEDPGGGDVTEIATNGIYNTGFTEESVTSFVNAFPDFLTSNSAYSSYDDAFFLRNRFNNIFMELCAIILYMERDTSQDPLFIEYIEITTSSYDVSTTMLSNEAYDEYFSKSYFSKYNELVPAGHNFQTDGTSVLQSTILMENGSLTVNIPQRVFGIKEALGYMMNTVGFDEYSVMIYSSMLGAGFSLEPETKPEQVVLTVSSLDHPYRYMVLFFDIAGTRWAVNVTCFEPVDTSAYINDIPLMVNGTMYNTGNTEESLNLFIERFSKEVFLDYDVNSKSLYDFYNLFVGVAAIVKEIERGNFTDLYVQIDELNAGINQDSLKAVKSLEGAVWYGIQYGGNLNPSNLVPPGAYFYNPSSGIVTGRDSSTIYQAKIPQDTYQLSMAIGYAQNTEGFVPGSMVLSSNNLISYTFSTASAPYQILAYTVESYTHRFKTLTFETNDGTIWLVRVQCFDPINTDGP